MSLEASQLPVARRFPLRVGIAYHAVLIGTTVIGAVAYAAVYLGWFGPPGPDLPEPFDEVFSVNPWIIFPVLAAWVIVSSYWLLRALPTEVVIGEAEIELRCPLQRGRWAAGQPLHVSIAPLWAWVSAVEKLYVLPRIYRDWDELEAALRERATPLPEADE